MAWAPIPQQAQARVPGTWLLGRKAQYAVRHSLFALQSSSAHPSRLAPYRWAARHPQGACQAVALDQVTTTTTRGRTCRTLHIRYAWAAAAPGSLRGPSGGCRERGSANACTLLFEGGKGACITVVPPPTAPARPACSLCHPAMQLCLQLEGPWPSHCPVRQAGALGRGRGRRGVLLGFS